MNNNNVKKSKYYIIIIDLELTGLLGLLNNDWHLIRLEFLEEFCSEFVGKVNGLDKNLEEVLGLYLEKRE